MSDLALEINLDDGERSEMKSKIMEKLSEILGVQVDDVIAVRKIVYG